MFKKILFCALFCVYALSWGFCDSWYVCFGSFKQIRNAGNFAQMLNNENIPACIYRHDTGTEVFYRVLLDKSFDFVNDARQQRDAIKKLPIIDKIDVSSLWACIALPENILNDKTAVFTSDETADIPISPDKHRIVSTNENILNDKTIVLTSNETADIPISPDKPYSVKVRSYKEESAAVNDKKRLVKNDIDAYVLKTYDDSSYFSFDVHAGAFETEDEVVKLQEKLGSLGIDDTKISDYKDIADSIDKYNEIIKTQDVIYDTGNSTIPTLFSTWVGKCIRQFPINENFQIEEIIIFDLDNIAAAKTESIDLDTVNDYLEGSGNVHAASLARYKDDLFNKEINIFIAAGDEDCFTPRDLEGGTEIQLAIVDDVLDCVVAPDCDDYILYGINKTGNMNVIMIGKDFTEEQFTEFVNNISSDSSLLVYPQLRKTLLVLPEKNDLLKRDFLYFTLSRIDESYASDRNYSAWSVPIVGHWEASSAFCQDDEVFSVSFFEMDYDYNARKIHSMFMKEKRSFVYEKNHPSNVVGADSWYIDNMVCKELSFSTKSYIIAIDSYADGSFDEDDLINISRELQIWE